MLQNLEYESAQSVMFELTIGGERYYLKNFVKSKPYFEWVFGKAKLWRFSNKASSASSSSVSSSWLYLMVSFFCESKINYDQYD